MTDPKRDNYTRQVLESLRDFIGDALSDDDITPQNIVEAIKDEITELLNYHQVAAGKAQKVLNLLGIDEDKEAEELSNEWNRFRKMDSYEDAQDIITFGSNQSDYFKLDSDFLNRLNDTKWNDDTIDFTDYKNKNK